MNKNKLPDTTYTKSDDPCVAGWQYTTTLKADKRHKLEKKLVTVGAVLATTGAIATGVVEGHLKESAAIGVTAIGLARKMNRMSNNDHERIIDTVQAEGSTTTGELSNQLTLVVTREQLEPFRNQSEHTALTDLPVHVTPNLDIKPILSEVK